MGFLQVIIKIIISKPKKVGVWRKPRRYMSVFIGDKQMNANILMKFVMNLAPDDLLCFYGLKHTNKYIYLILLQSVAYVYKFM